MKIQVSRRRIIGGVLSAGALVAVVAVAPASAGTAAAVGTTAAVATPTDAAVSTSPEKLKDITRAFYEGYNDRDLDTIFDRYISPDVVSHTGYDRDAWLAADKQIVAAFPDLNITVLDQLADLAERQVHGLGCRTVDLEPQSGSTLRCDLGHVSFNETLFQGQ